MKENNKCECDWLADKDHCFCEKHDGNRFGRMIKKARTKKKLTQDDLSEIVGLSQQYISAIEGEDVEVQKVDTVKKLASVLDLDEEKCLIAARCPEAVDVLERGISKQEKILNKQKEEIETLKCFKGMFFVSIVAIGVFAIYFIANSWVL